MPAELPCPVDGRTRIIRVPTARLFGLANRCVSDLRDLHDVSASRVKRTTVLALGLICGGLSTAHAQSVTLPTLRTFGPRPEEIGLFRLAADLRAIYGADTIAGAGKAGASATARAADSVARSTLRRVNLMVLASVTDQQIRRLEGVSKADSLVIIAGERHVASDLVPVEIRRALAAVADDEELCGFLSDEASQRLRQDAEKRTGIRLLSIPAERGDSIKRTATRTNVSCGMSLALQERLPARLAAGLRISERRAEISAKLDTLARFATAVVIRRKISGEGRTRYGMFPLTNRPQAEAFWQQRGLAPLNVGSISGSGSSGVVYTELVSPLLQAVRVSVNAVLVAEEQAEAPPAETPAVRTVGLAVADGDQEPSPNVKRLLGGGGLLNINFAWPLHYIGNDDRSIDLVTLLAPRLGLTAPVFGAATGNGENLNADLGIEIHAKAFDLVDGVGAIFQTRGGYVRGNGDYVKSLGVSRSAVAYGTISLGFVFDRQYMITASKAVFGPTVITKAPWQVGVTIVRLPSTP